MKLFRISAALLLATLCIGGAEAASRKESLAQFNDYVKLCTKDPGDRSINACLADQVMSHDSYLGDIVSETSGLVNEKAQVRLISAQKAFEKYRAAACAFDIEAYARADREQLFCFMRLTDERVANVLEGEDFAKLKK